MLALYPLPFTLHLTLEALRPTASNLFSNPIFSTHLCSLNPVVSNALLAASVSASATVNNENLKELDLGSGNKATKGLDYEAEITCANCSA